MQNHTQNQYRKPILLVLGKNKMSFGEKLSAWRKAKGYTQQELADAVNVNVSYISNLERDFSASAKSGKPTASENLCEKFSKVLGVPLDDVRLLAGYSPFTESELLREVRLEMRGSDQWTASQKSAFLQTLKIVVAGIKSENSLTESSLNFNSPADASTIKQDDFLVKPKKKKTFTQEEFIVLNTEAERDVDPKKKKRIS